MTSVQQGRAQARGQFEITMTPEQPEAEGAIYRFGFAKTWTGDLTASGRGVMMSGGDPAQGNAGYVAIEVVEGRLAGREGRFLLQQLGDLAEGQENLYYQVVSGSGTGELTGLSGRMGLEIDDDGVHRYLLEYALPHTAVRGREEGQA